MQEKYVVEYWRGPLGLSRGEWTLTRNPTTRNPMNPWRSGNRVEAIKKARTMASLATDGKARVLDEATGQVIWSVETA